MFVGFFFSVLVVISIVIRFEFVFGGSSFVKELFIIVVIIVLLYIMLVFGEFYLKCLVF